MKETESARLAPRYAEGHHGAPRPYAIERAEHCINCGTCVTACVYGCHERLDTDVRRMGEPKSDCCRNCLPAYCVVRATP